MPPRCGLGPQWQRRYPALISELDPFHRAILALMQDDARLKSDSVAERVGLSPTAVQRRLKRLRTNGVIQAEPLVLSPARVGRPLTAIVSITLARGGSAVVVTACDMANYDAFTRRILMDNALIQKFSTVFALSPVKSGLSLPLD